MKIVKKKKTIPTRSFILCSSYVVFSIIYVYNWLYFIAKFYENY